MLYYGTRISDNICKREPEGYLICKDVPVARIGKQKYLGDEIGLSGRDADKEFDVFRPEDEVFADATIASFEGMPITDDHPEDPVNADNIHLYQKGHVQNVHRGTGKESDMLIADLVITDPNTIQKVLDGKREISCGYDYNMDDSDGQYTQRQIRGNHVAIVDRGRAGHRVCIKDSAPNERRKGKSMRAKILSKMFASYAKDEEVTPEEVADAAEEIQAIAVEKPENTAPESVKDEEMPVTTPASDDRLDKIIEMLGRLLGEGQDEEPEVIAEEEKVEAEPDPLAKLEDDLTELEAMKKEEADEEPEEATSNFIDPEDINESEDEDITEEEVEEEVGDEDVVAEEEEKVMDKKGCDTAPIRMAIDALKPIIASLPSAQRKKASDSAAKALRKACGMDAKPKKNGYSSIKSARKAKDNANSEKGLAERIMAKRNPNYKK